MYTQTLLAWILVHAAHAEDKTIIYLNDGTRKIHWWAALV